MDKNLENIAYRLYVKENNDWDSISDWWHVKKKPEYEKYKKLAEIYFRKEKIDKILNGK